jgi:tetratricopeptide (TPR) repeat protein
MYYLNYTTKFIKQAKLHPILRVDHFAIVLKLNPLYMKLIKFILLCIIISTGNIYAQVKVTEKSWSLPTYKVSPGEKAPIFFSNESFQGARRVIYPYALNDVISHEKVNHNWKLLKLENEYIELGITPEIGGKIYYATDKTNNYNFLYKNNEVKPANIGMTGAWVSGGIEWCVLHHHRASTMLPMDYTMRENEDGSKTVFVGETEPRHRMRWTAAVTLKPGKSYFEAELTIYNPTPYTNTFLNWANVATHTNENYQTIFPPSVQLATYHSKNQFTRWPISTEVFRDQDFTKGVDVSWWKNVKQNASFFSWDLKEDFMGGYDHGKQSGTMHIGDHNIIKGAKLWEWGSGPVGQATEGRLTETSGPYVEVMVGAFSDNQPDYTWIRPYETKTWKQYWYPVRDIEGFKNANIDAAVNLEQRGKNKILLGYYSTQKLEKARIILKNGNKIILQKDLEISPAKAFKEFIRIKDFHKITDLSTELIDLSTNKTIITYQPKELKPIEKLPTPVSRPDTPEDVNSIEKLFLTGNRKEQFYKDPTDYYKEVLKRDPSDTRTNTAIGHQLLKDGNYKAARKHFSKAIKRLTSDYTRPSTGEALYLQGVTLKRLKCYEEAIDTLYRATWDYAYHSAGYFELAQISCLKGNFKKALHQINESLSTNMKNNHAIALKASIQRRLKNFKGAQKTIEIISQSDPLNFKIGNELYLIAKESENSEIAKKELTALTKKLRNFDQNYLELAISYINDGMLPEAKDVLLRFKGKHPIIKYYLGYIEDIHGHTSAAKKHFNAAQSLSESTIFPFRLETISALEKALQYNAIDGKASYYLGNILYNKQPSEAIKHWENAIKHEPKLAMAYRNLGWGYYRHLDNLEKATSYYEKALELDNKEAIVYSELDNLYELNNTSIEKRLKIFKGNSAIVRQRDDAFISQVTVLTLAGKPELSVAYLKGKEFSFREGNSKVREVIIDAQIALGMQYFNKKEYHKALKHFLLGQVPEEEAGSARSGNRNLQINYNIGLAYEALHDKKNAEKYFKLATILDIPDARRKSKLKGFMNYYQGLSYSKLGKKAKATVIFENLIAMGEKQLDPNAEDDSNYFQIFGEREKENVKKSISYTIRGLGYKGLKKNKLAKKDLEKAVELLASNLWAKIELNSL